MGAGQLGHLGQPAQSLATWEITQEPEIVIILPLSMMETIAMEMTPIIYYVTLKSCVLVRATSIELEMVKYSL